MRPLNRIAPVGTPDRYKTYTIASPLSTHYRTGTCEEAGCLAHRHGWVTRIDESTDFGQMQAYQIRKRSGRRFTEAKEPAGLTAFTFEAGQRCFREHKVPLERPELYVVRGGDWRGNPRGEVRKHTSPDAWVNDFGEHQDRIDRARNG